jgi:hypothetical protein
VPAGVPTTAPYQEPGDKVPMFTLAMFSNNRLGALATAKYYLDARNWSDALLDGTPFQIICGVKKCKDDAAALTKLKEAGHYVAGERDIPSGSSIVKAPQASGADWVVQVKLAITAGRLLDIHGKVLRAEGPSTKLINIYLKWNGKMWHVTGDFLAG